MRTALVLAAVLAFSGCGPDLNLGTFNFSLTGTDTETAPRSQNTGVAGSGSMSVTGSKDEAVDYVITVAQNDVGPCVFNLSRSDKDNTINLAAGQTCTFNYQSGQITATMTSGTFSVDEKGENATFTANYTWAGVFLGVNFAGTGTRTYTGPRR